MELSASYSFEEEFELSCNDIRDAEIIEENFQSSKKGEYFGLIKISSNIFIPSNENLFSVLYREGTDEYKLWYNIDFAFRCKY